MLITLLTILDISILFGTLEITQKQQQYLSRPPPMPSAMSASKLITSFRRYLQFALLMTVEFDRQVRTGFMQASAANKGSINEA